MSISRIALSRLYPDSNPTLEGCIPARTEGTWFNDGDDLQILDNNICDWCIRETCIQDKDVVYSNIFFDIFEK